MLDDAAEVLRIAVVALGAIGYSGTVVVEICRSAIFRSVRDYDDESLRKVALVHGRHPAGITENLGIVAVAETPSERGSALCGRVEAVVYYRIDAADAGLRRNGG